MNKKRALLIIVPNISKAGGTERVAINLANMLCDDFEIYLMGLAGNNHEPFYKIYDKVNLVTNDLGEIPTKIQHKVYYFYRMYKHLKIFTTNNNIEIIMGLGHNINFVVSFLKNKRNLIIGCEHINYHTIPRFSKLLMRASYPHLDAVVVLSEQAKINIKPLNDNVVVIPNAIPFQTDKVASLEKPTIIMVGRLSPEKGYERVVPIAKYLQTSAPEWQIKIFGDGDYYDELKLLYDSNDLKNVTIHKAVKDIKGEYLNSSILLSTSHSEAMPMVFLEAMSCGLPVISYRHEGAESLIKDGYNGFIVDTCDDLINKLTYLIQNKKIGKEISKNCILFSKDYDLKEIHKKWKQFLDNIL